MTLPETATVLEALDRDGYMIVEGVLNSQEVAGARAELRTLLERTPLGRNDFEGHRTRRIYAIFAKTRLFDGPATHPLVLAVLDHYLYHYQLSAPTGIEIGPGEEAQALHPDDGIYPIPRPHRQLVVNVMWPLDEFTEANGATRIVPGSHRWGDEQPGPGAQVISAEMPAGSALVYLGTLWHGGGANRTDRPRLGVVMHYAASWLRPQENHLLAVPRDTVRALPQRLQELLGYNICPPFIGYVDGHHPRRLLEDPARR